MESLLISAYTACLKNEVAVRFGQEPRKSTDFKRLSESIAESGAGYLSQSTLKRLWGYVRDTERKHRSTLDVLARYVGDADFTSFTMRIPKETLKDSGYASDKTLDVSTLTIGTEVELTWIPNRTMVLTYCGNYTFEVKHSMHTRLSKGMKVRCMHITAHQALHLDIISDERSESMIYVVGHRMGINWTVKTPK